MSSGSFTVKFDAFDLIASIIQWLKAANSETDQNDGYGVYRRLTGYKCSEQKTQRETEAYIVHLKWVTKISMDFRVVFVICVENKKVLKPSGN